LRIKGEGEELKYTIMGINMMEIGKPIRGKVEENSSGRMEITMKETGRITKLMEKEKWSILIKSCTNQNLSEK